MRYRSRNNIKKIAIPTIILVVVVLFVVTGLFSKSFYGSMVLMTSGKSTLNQTASSFAGLFTSKNSLVSENNALKAQIAQKDAELADKDILIKENSDLKAESYSTNSGNSSNKILAQVMSKPPFTPFDILVVGKGTNQNVKVGDRVMLGQTYLGNVTQSSSNSSEVTLNSSASQSLEAYIGNDALPAVLNGKGGGNFEANLPQGSNVSAGDLVFSYYNQTPYLIGKVEKVISNENNTYIDILVALPINIYSLTDVQIIS